MRRILFSWNSFNVYSYMAMMYLGLFAGVFGGAHEAQLSGMSPDKFAVATMILVIPAMVGSQLLFVLPHWYVYLREVQRIWRRSEGGLAMYGRLIAAVPLSIPVLRAMHLPFAAFWDAATFTILVGMVFTRAGCLLNGCCGGRPTGLWFGLNLPDQRGVWRRRVPTQILEMILTAILLSAASITRGREPFTGAIFLSAIVAYGAVRYIVGQLRDDGAGRSGCAIQAASIGLVIAAQSLSEPILILERQLEQPVTIREIEAEILQTEAQNGRARRIERRDR